MALASIQGCGRVEYRTYGVSIVGEYGKGGWFERGGVDPLSWGVPARLAPSLASSVGLRSLVLVKSSLGKENPSIYVVISLFICLGSSKYFSNHTCSTWEEK